MLKIHICEDNGIQRDTIKQFVEHILEEEALPMEIGYTTDNPYMLLEKIQSGEKDIFFLDIDLQCDMNGLKLAEQIRKHQPRCYIIFVTTHSELSYMTFEYKVETLDFILKDNPEDMKDRMVQCLLHIQKIENSEKRQIPTEIFSIHIGSKTREVPLEDILFFKVEAHKILLHTQNGILEFSGRLKEIESKLNADFYRCHRSYIVNTKNIESVIEDENLVQMKNGETCPFSSRLKKGLMFCYSNNRQNSISKI